MLHRVDEGVTNENDNSCLLVHADGYKLNYPLEAGLLNIRLCGFTDSRIT